MSSRKRAADAVVDLTIPEKKLATPSVDEFFRARKEAPDVKKDGTVEPVRPVPAPEPLGVNAEPTAEAKVKPELEQDRQEQDAIEKKTDAFDLDMRFGPSLGLSRAERIARAKALGMKVPSGLPDGPSLFQQHMVGA